MMRELLRSARSEFKSRVATRYRFVNASAPDVF